MQSLMRDRDWSRRHFLLLGIMLPAMPAAAGLPLAGDSLARPGPAIPLAIASRERLTPQLHAAPALLVLHGDRLARLNQLRRRLAQDVPSLVALHLDATDLLMWNIASTEAGVTAAGLDGEVFALTHDARLSASAEARA
jgi:hypothetical protein